MYKKAAHFVQGTGFRASPVGVGVNQNFPLSISHKGWLQELLECSKCGFLIKRSDVNEHLNSRCKLHRSTKVRLSIYLKKRRALLLNKMAKGAYYPKKIRSDLIKQLTVKQLKLRDIPEAVIQDFLRLYGMYGLDSDKINAEITQPESDRVLKFAWLINKSGKKVFSISLSAQL